MSTNNETTMETEKNWDKEAEDLNQMEYLDALVEKARLEKLKMVQQRNKIC
jgi:hypothetical protein